MKTIGLIGGMSWQSSVVYYQVINRRTNERLGGSHSARSLMYSVEFDETARLQHEGRWGELKAIMIDAAERLARGGADFFLIATNTMHMFADEMEQASGIPLLHIGDAVGEAIRKASMRKVGLLGTRFTMEQDFLKGRLLEKYGIETIVPDMEDRETVHAVIYNELVNGEIRDEARKQYLQIIDKLTANGAEGIILGCTEIPLLVSAEDTAAVLFDTTQIHAENAVDFALSGVSAAAV